MRTIVESVILPEVLKLSFVRPKRSATQVTSAREFSDSAITGPVLAFYDSDLELIGCYSPYEEPNDRMLCMSSAGAFILADDNELTKWAAEQLAAKVAGQKKAQAERATEEAVAQEAKATAVRMAAVAHAEALLAEQAARSVPAVCGKATDEGACGRPPGHGGPCRAKKGVVETEREDALDAVIAAAPTPMSMGENLADAPPPAKKRRK